MGVYETLAVSRDRMTNDAGYEAMVTEIVPILLCPGDILWKITGNGHIVRHLAAVHDLPMLLVYQ